MDELLVKRSKRYVALLLIACALPASAMAKELYSSTLTNETQKYDTAGKGYTMELVATWGKDCVADVGKNILHPGESSVLKINPGCEWGGVRYKMVEHGIVMGYVGQSFRDKQFSVELSIPCKDNNCTISALPPQ
jgi:hypothetical protein